MSGKYPDEIYLFPPMAATWSPPFAEKVVMLTVSENFLTNTMCLVVEQAQCRENLVSVHITRR